MSAGSQAGPGGPTARPPLWTPSRERTRASNLAAFAAWLSEQGSGPGGAREHPAPPALAASPAPPEHAAPHAAPAPYHPLWRWSIDDQAAFWSAAWDWFGIVGERGSRVLVDGDRMPGARYFPDARLNFAENLLRRRTDDPAIIAWSEDGRRRVVSWRELHDLVSRLAQAMRAAGVGPGDRVAALLPNVPEAVVVLLATTSIGAVLSTASPDFGARGVIDRFGQVGPRLLFVTDGYSYRGRRYHTLERVPEILDGLPTVERTIVVPNLAAAPGDPAGSGPANAAAPAATAPPSGHAPELPAAPAATAPPAGHAPEIPGALAFDNFIRPFEAREIDFVRLPFDHPLFILFSSGTTGVPKCIVHRAGGVLLQHIKEHQLHCDIKAGDRVFYFTTLGWMMWNWLVSALASEATILLWDGSPVDPGHDALFDFADATGATLMGVSPGYLEALRKAGVSPRASHGLAPLRTFLSTGSPLAAAGFEYVYEHVKRDVHLVSISGGTDLCACFLGAIPGWPVRGGRDPGAGSRNGRRRVLAGGFFDG